MLRRVQCGTLKYSFNQLQPLYVYPCLLFVYVYYTCYSIVYLFAFMPLSSPSHYCKALSLPPSLLTFDVQEVRERVAVLEQQLTKQQEQVRSYELMVIRYSISHAHFASKSLKGPARACTIAQDLKPSKILFSMSLAEMQDLTTWLVFHRYRYNSAYRYR